MAKSKIVYGESLKMWTLVVCPECEKEFIAKLKVEVRESGYEFTELPETLTCPYCGIKNDIYAEGYPYARQFIRKPDQIIQPR